MSFGKFLFGHRFSHHLCRRYTTGDSARPIVVTITSGTTRVGQTVALLLKQCAFIDEIRLFDYQEGSCGAAVELNHVDTTTEIKAYTGIHMLRAAVEGAKIVVICGGDSAHASVLPYELFRKNADYVRNVALYITEFAPNAVVCIATPPIASMVPLVSEEFKKAQVYNPRKVVGIMTHGMMRANSIIGTATNSDPAKISCPVVGGMTPKTLVAVLSQTDCGSKLPPSTKETLRQKIANAENDVLAKNYIENKGPCCISVALGCSRFVRSVARGLLNMFQGFECGFVEQKGDVREFLPYMGSIIRLGRRGIEGVHMPKLDSAECTQLQRAARLINMNIHWGAGYVTGATPRKRERASTIPACEVVALKTDDVDKSYDPSPAQARQKGSLLPNAS